MAIYWQSPTVILSTLIAGILFAVGHHIFYSSLAGREAPSGNYNFGGFNYSKQQANVQVGTAFAFLVQACLAASVVTSYAQLFWRTTISSDARRSTTLDKLDIAHGVTSNVFFLFRPNVWRRRPAAFTLALMAWLLPIASIITPGTLAVKLSADVTPTQQLMTPSPDFVNLGMVGDLSSNGFHAAANDDKNYEYRYNGASQAVVRVANSVASGGSILPIRPPAPNSSWEMEFYGPSIQCTNLVDADVLALSRNIANENFGAGNCRVPYGYVAFAQYDTLPFGNNANTTGRSSFFTTPLSREGDVMRLLMVATPGMWRTVSVPGHAESAACKSQNIGDITAEKPMGDYYGANSTFLRCSMYNSTYHLGFNYTNGRQDIAVRADGIDEATPMKTIGTVYGPNTFTPRNCSVFNLDNRECVFDAQAAQAVSYQSIMSAFSTLVVGTIQRIFIPNEAVQQSALGTRVTTTTLLDTPELAFLRDRQAADPSQLGFTSLQSKLTKYDPDVISEISAPKSQPLARALEELFQNITISLMSSQDLLRTTNTSSPDAAPLTTVTLPAYYNIYVYGSLKLWLAYGLAILAALVAAVAASIVMVTTGKSYSSNFSTIFRAASFAHLEPDVMEKDADGRDPLPKYLKGAHVVFVGGGKGGRVDSRDDAEQELKEAAARSRLLETASRDDASSSGP